MDGLADRIVGITAEQLRAIRSDDRIAYGDGKAAAVAAAIAGGVVKAGQLTAGGEALLQIAPAAHAVAVWRKVASQTVPGAAQPEFTRRWTANYGLVVRSVTPCGGRCARTAPPPMPCCPSGRARLRLRPADARYRRARREWLSYLPVWRRSSRGRSGR